jgi:DNA-binding CsgD family transcriptional regulator
MTLPRAGPLRGRDAELAAVAAALRTLEQGRGQALIAQAPPGMGKTALLAEACSIAERAGARVLAGEAYESRQSVPFAPLLAALSAPEPPVIDASLAKEFEGGADTRYWMLQDLLSALEAAAARSPLVIAIDDVQWADNATLAALGFLIPAVAGLPILWLLAVRTGHGRRTLTETLTRLEQDDAIRLRMSGLSPNAVEAILADVLGGDADPALIALADRAQGHPFMLVELLRGLREEGRLCVIGGRAGVVGDGLPSRLTASMADRLATLSADAEQLVRVAAALPPRFSAAQLAAVLRLPPSSLLAPLNETLEADLLIEAGQQLKFRHDLLRQAVLETMPRSLRRALQRDAVTVLLQTGAAPGEVARQLAESAEPGDRAAAATLREAARSIAGSDAVAAAQLGVRALDLLPAGDTERGPLTAETVTLLHRARRSAEAVALADRALAGVLPVLDEADLRLSLSSMMTRPTLSRTQENRSALALPELPPLLRSRHFAWLAYNLAVGGEPEPASVAAASALREAELTGDLEACVMAGVALACTEGFRGGYLQALDRIEGLRRLSLGHDRALFAAVLAFHRAYVLAALGRLDEARGAVVAGVVSARQERDALVLTAWTQFGGLLRLAAGELSDARAEAVWAVGKDDEPPVDTFAGVTRMVALCHVGAHSGDTASLRAGRAAARRVGADSSSAVRRLASRLLAGTASGPGSAVEAARLLADDPLAPGTPLVACDYGYQPRVARIARAAGILELAERAAAVTESVDSQNPGVPLFAGLAAQTRGIAGGDTALLVDASLVLQGTQRPLVAASAAEDAGSALAERRYTSDAVEHLQRALDVYAALGASADVRRVARLLRNHGVDRRVSVERPESGWTSLTASELQVARIIAGGATNRSAAEQLYLSPHTVSSHLRSAFAKLGITSRMQLAGVLHDVEP